MRRSVVLLVVLVGCADDPGCPVAPGLEAARCDEARALALPAALPTARGDAHADDERAALLGFQLFFDARLSRYGEERCATCHAPEQHFADGRATSPGTHRNAPTILNAARLGWQFWDGRADSLWSQPLFPLESPSEMASTRLETAHTVYVAYRKLYEDAFGPMPDLSDTTRFPPSGKPGDPAWGAMAPADQDAIDRVYANVGKSLEAYMRKLAAGPSKVDRWLAGDTTALSAEEARGLAVLVDAGCTRCHAGPMLTDEKFHDLGLPALPGAPVDRGRADGLAVLATSEWASGTPYADGPPYPAPAEDPATAVGAFRTPSLRNLTLSAPYMHDGRFATLEEAVDFHLAGGGRGTAGVLGTVDSLLQPVKLSADDRAALLALLRALTGAYPPPPWNSWPQG